MQTKIMLILCFYFLGRWCRREWNSPPDPRTIEQSRRIYSSVFLGSPGKKFLKLWYILKIIKKHSLNLKQFMSLMRNYVINKILCILVSNPN